MHILSLLDMSLLHEVQSMQTRVQEGWCRAAGSCLHADTHTKKVRKEGELCAF